MYINDINNNHNIIIIIMMICIIYSQADAAFESSVQFSPRRARRPDPQLSIRVCMYVDKSRLECDLVPRSHSSQLLDRLFSTYIQNYFEHCHFIIIMLYFFGFRD